METCTEIQSRREEYLFYLFEETSIGITAFADYFRNRWSLSFCFFNI